MSDSKIPERWLPVTRIVWFALIFVLLMIYVAGISPYYDELRVPCTTADCLDMALSPQEAQELQDLGISLEFFAGYQVGIDIFAFLIFIPLAGVVYWRKSDTWLGFLLSLGFVFFGAVTVKSAIALGRQYPDLAWPLFFLDFSAGLIFVLLFYVFPDGRFVPRWSPLVVIALAGVFFIDLLFPTRDSLSPSYSALAETLWLGMLLGGVLAQIYRYRWVSTPTQRQQTKWVMFGMIVVFVAAAVWTLPFEIYPLQSGSTRLALKLSLGFGALLYAILPLSVVFSILRYRLWDIDIIIRKTLVYALLTALLASVYFGAIILLQSIIETVSGQQSAISIVISTLFIAALFAPLRRRIQDFIDRRFYRRKYDAEKTLAAFGQFVRDETDLEALMAELLRVTEETMQPEQVSIWLNQATRAGETQLRGKDN